jgi:hypothetical protein
MHELHEVVYAITAKGFAALRSDDVNISLDLKTVLTLVDGICPVAQYIPFLQVFHPLEDKFATLEKYGLVRRVGTVSGFAVKMFHNQSRSGVPVSKMQRIDAEYENSGFSPMAE